MKNELEKSYKTLDKLIYVVGVLALIGGLSCVTVVIKIISYLW